MDCEVAVRRIRTVLSRTSSKLKLAVCLPAILKHEDLPKILTRDEISTVQATCESYVSFPEDADESVHDFNDFNYNPQFTTVIEILHNYPEVHELAEQFLIDAPEASRNLIYTMELFSSFIEKRMRTTPTEHRQHVLKLRNLFANAKKSEADITVLQEALKEQRSKHKAFMGEITNNIARDEMLLTKLKKRLDEEIASRINNAESQMVKTFLEMRATQESLQSQIDNCSEVVRTIMHGNAQREKELRARRTKVESQFVTLLGKYDTEIGARHELMESLMMESESLRTEQENLQRELSEQEVLYMKLKEEKELAAMNVHKQRLNDFVKNRAAKVIQKSWRAHHERSSVRKKKKSKKK